MREYEFRGKDIKTGWYHGLLCAIFTKFNSASINQENGFFAVSLDTIGQYTGVQDSCGLKIFEGDIVRSTSDFGIGVVKFIQGSFYVEFSKSNLEYLCQEDLEVIGNIYDNPELLEKVD